MPSSTTVWPCYRVVRLAVRCSLTPILRDAISPHLVDGFEWNLAKIFIIWVGTSEKISRSEVNALSYSSEIKIQSEWPETALDIQAITGIKWITKLTPNNLLVSNDVIAADAKAYISSVWHRCSLVYQSVVICCRGTLVDTDWHCKLIT